MTVSRATVDVLARHNPQLPQWWSGQRVSEALGRVDLVVPVLGAGVGREAGLPDGRQLAEWLADHAPMTERPRHGAELFDVVDAIDPGRMERAELSRIVAEHIQSFQPRSTPFVDELVRLPSRFIVTFSYDDLVAFAAKRQGQSVRRLSALNPDECREAHRRVMTKGAWPPSELTIFHLHGQAREPQTLVLGESSYADLMNQSYVKDIVSMLAHRHGLVFVGTTLNEDYLRVMLQGHPHAASHVVLCHEEDVQRLTTGRGALSRRQHLLVVSYPDHRDLMVLPLWLNAPQPARGPLEPAGTLDPEAAPDAADYVDSEFSERAPTETPVSERDIRDGHRTVVVGVAGSGKTHLLSWLAANPRADRPAVRIRLADVKIRPGRAHSILEAWARSARSAPGQATVDVSASALRDDRLHFLLDGLDEVANEQQETAATLIAQVAERFPQHAFTVTSRRLPALAALDADATPWRFVDLAPGTDWQQRYLARRGLTLAQLEAAMPALADMRELLHIPFFLTRTVKLFEQSELVGLRDVGELLGRLVDFALSREMELLPMVGLDDVRAWLRRVALAAAITGRRTFTFPELREIPVVDGLAGDLGELVRQMQLRLLLAEDDGSLRFSHRLLADELVAEALAEMEPSDALLDTLVPVADEELAGVRDDVVIAVTLLCLRSATWRAAVAHRDPLAAARSTPSDATPAERAASSTLLWETYEDWRVWAWNLSTADLVEDAEVIARLLRRDPDSPHVAHLRRLLHAGDEIQQGNALRVLARVRPDGLARDLRRVLRDPRRNSVVVREAAMAASGLGLTELIDDIVAAMIGSSDSAIHQVGSMALRDLTPEDQLLDVAKRLMPCRKGNLLAAFIGKRMSPAERIELARAVALSDQVEALASDRADLRNAAREVTPTPDVVQAAACAAAFWRDSSTEVKLLLDHDPQAAALGLLEARDHGARWWDIAPLAAHADLDLLRDGLVDERIIQAAERDLELRAMPPEERDELIHRAADSARARSRSYEALGAQHAPPPSLAELLRKPAAETDKMLQAEAFELRGQVGALAEQDLLELRARLTAWWPKLPFKDQITVHENDGFTLTNPANAWLFLAPAAEMPVTDEQWAQIATNPVILHEQSAWLRLQATVTRMKRALQLMSDPRARAWLRLLDCCPAPPPESVVAACAAAVESDAESPHDTIYLMQRLAAGGVTEGVRAWAARNDLAAQALRPMLALENDREAQRFLVGELLEAVRTGRTQPHEDVGWMSALRAPEFLDALFEILKTAYHSSGDQPSSGWRVHNVLTPTMEAIATIGTREAVRLYDAVLARGDDLRWLRPQRNRIAGEILSAQGSLASRAAAAAICLPSFMPGG